MGKGIERIRCSVDLGTHTSVASDIVVDSLQYNTIVENKFNK